MWRPERSWKTKSIPSIKKKKKGQIFLNMVTPVPTIMLPLQHWQRASDLNLFHTLPTAWIWYHLTSGFRSSRESSPRNSFHMWWRCGFKNNLKNSTPTGSRNLFSAGNDVALLAKMRYRKKVHLWAIFCILFHFYTLSGCKYTNTEALLSKLSTWHLTQTRKHILPTCKNRLLMRIFESKRNKGRM